MKHIPINRLLRYLERESSLPRFTVAQKLDLLRCIGTLKRCQRQREKMHKDLREYFEPQISSYDLSVHEQYQTCMTILSQGLQDRFGAVEKILTSRSRKAVLGLFHSHVHTRL